MHSLDGFAVGREVHGSQVALQRLLGVAAGQSLHFRAAEGIEADEHFLQADAYLALRGAITPYRGKKSSNTSSSATAGTLTLG